MDESSALLKATAAPETENSIRKSLFTVTPLSRWLALILFLILPFWGFWLGLQSAPIDVVTVWVPITVERKSVDEVPVNTTPLDIEENQE
jgi:hypothetical protein